VSFGIRHIRPFLPLLICATALAQPQDRSAGLYRLIASDPDAALRLTPELAPELATAQEIGGVLRARVEDDFEHNQSRVRWSLQTATETIEIYPAAAVQPLASAPVMIRGVRVRDRMAVSAMRRANPADAAQTATSQCTTTGPQNIAVVMATTPSNPAFPPGFSAAAVAQEFFGQSGGSLSTASLNSYWQDASYGQTSATGQVAGPFALSQDFTCDQLPELLSAAVAAADSSVDFTRFSRVAVLFPVSSCVTSESGVIGGAGSIGCQTISSSSKGVLPASAAWLPVYPFQQLGLWLGDVAHELGHNLGLNHASTDSFTGVPLGSLDSSGTLSEYGDPASAMGQTWTTFNGQPVLGQYSAEHKAEILNWLAPGGYQQVTSPGTFTLAPFEASAGLRALRVLRDAASNSWLWLEYRQPLGDADSSLALAGGLNGLDLFAGALVHYETQALDPLHTYLLDFQSPSGPVLEPGATWPDPYSPLTISAGTPNAQGLPITVSYASSCASMTLSAASFSASGGVGTISVTADSSCFWTLTSAADWISVPGASSGQGTATLAFSVAANGSSHARSGNIQAGRQNLTIVQTGTGPAVLGVTPSSGAGSSQLFQFNFTDPAGFSDMQWAMASFGGMNCEVAVSPTGGYAWLWNPSPAQWAGPVYLRANSLITNGACALQAAPSSAAGSGTNLTVSLQMSFSASFSGTHPIAADATTQNGSQVSANLGTWTSGQ